MLSYPDRRLGFPVVVASAGDKKLFFLCGSVIILRLFETVVAAVHM